ncbi:MAG TPA: CehA/McbA family metallohydrolase [Lacipirellulaceae bacterium]|nr:CehA/McbA family metallohydrolase [Lacipirellulaceae bacterium]
MIRRPVSSAVVFWLVAAAPYCPSSHAAPRGDGQLTIEVVDSDSGKPIAARMHLKNSRGRPVALRLPNTAEFGGHFYIDGQLTLPLRIGQYTFELDAGPEYRTQSGHFEIERHADDSKRIEMKRFADLAKEGWYGGDLDVLRRPADMPLIMRAEVLSVAPTKIERSPAERRSAAELLFFNLQKPLDDKSTEYGHSWLSLIKDARALGGRVVSRTPYAWDIPAWLASGQLDAVNLINHHALRDDVLDHEKDGRPRDRSLFPGRTGNGRWAEAVYYHALNCGLRIPPAAGSGSGENDNPVGTNRVYVYCGEEFSDEAWWEGLEAGRVFVTNGPLLRPAVEGHPPGYVFRLDEGAPLTLEIALDLATRVPVEYLQIVKNGTVENEVRLADWTKQKGRLPPLRFDASGWFLVRAVTGNQRTYQFASSGPYYVEKAGGSRVSRRSVQFFLDWIAAAGARVRAMKDLDDQSRQALLAEHESARRYFEELLAGANAE